MRTTFIFLSLAFLPIFESFAQPVINASDVAATLDAEVLVADIPPGFYLGNSNPNQIWNFSSLVVEPAGFISVTTPDMTPYPTNFPGANYALHYQGPFAESYHFYNLMPAKYEKTGSVFVAQAVENYQNPRTYVQFPFTLGTTFTDTYQTTFSSGPVECTYTYDAYGTLILPFGTYNNVIRQKIVIDGQVDYIWYHTNPFYSLVETSLVDNYMGITKGLTLGVDDHQIANGAAVYPNPAKDRFEVLLKQSGAIEISVFDAAGRCIVSQESDGNKLAIDASAFQSGIYMIQATDSYGRTFTQKLVKQ